MAKTTKITLTSKREISSGNSNNGPWTLYGYGALDASGDAIEDGEVKSFQDLPMGEVTVEVEKQVHDKYGTSFMIKDPSRKGGLKESVDDLRARVEHLEQMMANNGTPAVPSSQGQSQHARRQAQKETAPAATPPDDDIPF